MSLCDFVKGGYMFRTYKIGLTAMALGFVAASQAITFSNFQINGSATSGNPTLFGTNGLTWTLPTNFLVGLGTSTITLDYDVQATSGFFLDGFTVTPVGTAKNGTVSVTNNHINGGTQTDLYTRTAGGTQMTLDPETFSLTGNTAFHVTAVISLTGLMAGTDSINKLTIYNVSYSEAPVPEPATMAAMLVGGGFLASRRKRRNK